MENINAAIDKFKSDALKHSVFNVFIPIKKITAKLDNGANIFSLTI